MKRPSFPAGLVLGFVATGTAVTAGDVPPPFVEATFEALAIEDTECSAELQANLGRNVETRCGKFEGEFRQFKRSWRSWIELEAEGAPIRNRTEWIRDRRFGRKMYLFSGGGPYRAVATREGILALSWIDSWPRCESAAREEGRSWIPKEELRRCESPCEYREPERTEYLAPPYPGAARRDKRSGAVLLWAVIDERGRPGNVCLAGVNPAGYGFEESAKRAIEQWRYAPAILNGEPVAVSFVVTTTFHVDADAPPLYGLYERIFVEMIPE